MAEKERMAMQRRFVLLGFDSRVVGLFLCVLSLFAAQHSVAGLRWETTSETIEVHPLQASVIVPFRFSNDGTGTIEILELEPTCGCTSGNIGKRMYQPGEGGVVEVLFNLEKREGLQRKGIAVKTSDSKETTLYVGTNIQPSFQVSPKRLVWEAGEVRAGKSFRIVNQNERPFLLERAVPARDGLAVELVTKKEGFEYELVVVPDPELKNVLIPVDIYPEPPECVNQVKRFTAYVLLK